MGGDRRFVPARQTGSGRVLVAALLLAAASAAGAVDYRAAIEYSINHRNGDDVEPLTLHLAGLELGLDTLLWRDWIGHVSGDVRFTRSYTRTTSNGDSQGITGNARLSLFPKSRFPFQAFFRPLRFHDRFDGKYPRRPDFDAGRFRPEILQQFRRPLHAGLRSALAGAARRGHA